MGERVSAGVLALALLAGLVGCGDDGDADNADGIGAGIGGTVLVFAAASLADAFAEVETAFEA